MIILHIKKGEKECATLECGRGEFRFVGGYDERFREFLETSVAKGIAVPIDVRDKDSGSLTITKRDIKKEDIEPYMLRDFLRYEGYEVRESHPEVEREIRSLIEEIPDTASEKKDFLKRLPGMSHLEQTALLQKLREAGKE